MKYHSQRLFKWAIFLAVFSLRWVDSAEERDDGDHRLLLRRKRNACQDGMYIFEGRTCCLCAPGQRLIRHCVVQGDGVCDYCEQGKTFNSRRNAETTCEPCTSCTQPNANLAVKEECTIAKDTVCQCKEGHYCSSSACTSCDPCETCDGKVVKTPCMATNNTVCGEQVPGKATFVALAAIPAAIITIAALAIVLICWRKKWLCFGKKPHEEPAEQTEQELETLLEDVDLSRLAPDIAEAVGWKDMSKIALATGFSHIAIENHKLNHPQDIKEQTLALLQEWLEKQGRRAPRELVNRLKAMNRTRMVEKVLDIIQRDRRSPD